MATSWETELTPAEQFVAHSEIFCAGERLTYGLQFKPLTHISDGVWELKTPVCWWIQASANQTGKFEFDIQLIKDEKDTLLRVKVGFEIHAKGWVAMILPKVPIQLHGPGKLQITDENKKRIGLDYNSGM